MSSVQKITYHMNWLILISSLVGISFSGAFLDADGKGGEDTSFKAERLSLEAGPLKTISYFSDEGSGFLVVTMSNDDTQKHIYRGIKKTLWEEMKRADSPLPLFESSVAHRHKTSVPSSFE